MDAEQLRQETLNAYEEFSGAITAYARRLTADKSLAQDAVQETFLRFFLARMQNEIIRNRSAWLHRVTHNYICETMRSQAVRASVALDEAASENLHAKQHTEEAELEEAFVRLLAPRESQCLRLRAEGLDYTEIAAQMSIRPGTVGTLLHRAAQKLRAGIAIKWRSS